MKASVEDRGSGRRGAAPTRFRPGAAAGVATALAGAALGLSAGSASGTHWGGVTTYSPVGQSNGIDVFLSPAHHWGPNASQVIADKAGCFGYVEEENNRLAALRAANNSDYGAGGLRQRGYYVKIGASWPDDNAPLANQFNYDVYVAMHTNGSTSDGSTCSGAAYRFEAYYSTASNPGNSSAFAGTFASVFDNSSNPNPGYSPEQNSSANKKVGANFWEIRGSNNSIADRVYMETNFHDNATGWSYAKSYTNWAWRVGWSVDSYLGYP